MLPAACSDGVGLNAIMLNGTDRIYGWQVCTLKNPYRENAMCVVLQGGIAIPSAPPLLQYCSLYFGFK